MKIEEAISKLEDIKNKYGNLDLKCLVQRICWSDGHLVGAGIGDVDFITSNGKFILLEGKDIEC